MEATTKTNTLSSFFPIRRQCPATTKPSFYKPIPSLSNPFKIKPLSISIKSNPSYSVRNTLLPIVSNPKSKPKTMLIPSSPIPILQTSFIKALTAVTFFFAGHHKLFPPVISDEEILESSKTIFTEMIKKSPLLSGAYHVLLRYSSPLDPYSELENIMGMIEERMNSEDFKSVNTESLIGLLLMYAFYHEKMGNYTESFRIYDGLVTKFPEDDRVYLCKGGLHALLKEEDEEDKCFQKYSSLVRARMS